MQLQLYPAEQVVQTIGRLDLSISCHCVVPHQLNDPVMVYLVRWNVSDYTAEFIACINGHVRQCVQNIPTCIRLHKLSESINDMIRILVNEKIFKSSAIYSSLQITNQIPCVVVRQSVLRVSNMDTSKAFSQRPKNIIPHSILFAKQISDISPEYLLSGTAYQRIRKSTGSRYLLIILLQQIEETLDSFEDFQFETSCTSISCIPQIERFQSQHIGSKCGYQLSDGSLGIGFCDKTNLILSSDFEGLYYINKASDVRYFKNESSAPPFLQFKLKCLAQLKGLALKQKNADAQNEIQKYDIPYLLKWMRWQQSTVFYFNNGTLEIIYDFGRKLVFSPFAKPKSVSAERRYGELSKFDYRIAQVVCNILLQRYYRNKHNYGLSWRPFSKKSWCSFFYDRFRIS